MTQENVDVSVPATPGGISTPVEGSETPADFATLPVTIDFGTSTPKETPYAGKQQVYSQMDVDSDTAMDLDDE